MTTALNKIQKQSFNRDGWETLLEALGKTEADDELRLSAIKVTDTVEIVISRVAKELDESIEVRSTYASAEAAAYSTFSPKTTTYYEAIEVQ